MNLTKQDKDRCCKTFYLERWKLSVSKVFMGQSQLLIAAFLKSAEVATLNASLPPGKVFTTASELVINFFQV